MTTVDAPGLFDRDGRTPINLPTLTDTAPADEGSRTCQNEPFTSAGLVGALESAWTAIRARHPQIPAVVIVIGSSVAPKPGEAPKWGHFASLRWQHGATRLPEVLVCGEGLSRSPAEVLTTLLHEATHALADARGIQETSRQGRWHNKRFVALAAELGMTVAKDQRVGWSVCTLMAGTADSYRPVLAELAAAMRAYRRPEEATVRSRTNNNNGLTLACDCARKIRVSVAVAEEGPILCGTCHTRFLSDEQRESATAAATVDNPSASTGDGLPVYTFRAAPDGLATRRQLRRIGLTPGGQPIAGRLVWRDRQRFAYLYRIDLAVPRRPMTEAKRSALDQANRARRTCPKCGSVRDYVIGRRLGRCHDCVAEVA